jgi:hypothetical protein
MPGITITVLDHYEKRKTASDFTCGSAGCPAIQLQANVGCA